MLAATVLDVTEVLRETAASGAAVAAVVAGIVAATALVVGVVLVVRERRRPGGNSRSQAGATGLAVVAVLVGSATVVEVALLVIDGVTITERRALVAVARLLVLAAAVAVRRVPADDPVLTPLLVGLGTGALATVALGAPALGNATDLGVAVAVTFAIVIVAGALLELVLRKVTAPAAAVVAVALLATPASLVLAPDRVPPHHQERIVVNDVVLDVTVAPLRPGRNEVHLYAWDGVGRPLTVASTSVEVRGQAATRHELFIVSPNHHLSYALELPHADAWQLELTVQVADGPVVDATLDLEAP